MQVRIHRLGAIEVALGQALVGEVAPVAAFRLDIAAKSLVPENGIDRVALPAGQIEHRLIPCHGIVFGQGVNEEGLGIGLLARIGDLALRIDAPVETAVVWIDEMGDQIVEGALCQVKRIRAPITMGHGRKEP